jgi:hypothetical protein
LTRKNASAIKNKKKLRLIVGVINWESKGWKKEQRPWYRA